MLKVQNENINDPNLFKVFRVTKFIEQNNFFEMMGYLRFKNIEKIETLNLLQVDFTL